MKRNTLLLIGVLSALMLALVGGAAAEPVAPDAAAPASFIPGEPNDTFATANDAFEGYLMTPADVDYLLLDLPVAYRLRPAVIIYRDDNKPVVLRVELALYDAAHTLLAEDADCDATAALPDQFVAAGVYYLRVRACAGAFDGDQVYYVDTSTYSWPYEWEPNNSRATANPFDHGDTEAAIAPAGDVDFFRFNGQAREEGYLSLNPIDAGLQLDVALMAADGTVLGTASSGFFHYTLPADGDYFFRVRSAAGMGAYRIYGEHALPETFPGDVEPNDTPAQAVAIAYGDEVWGEVVETDVDYFRFDGQAGDAVALAPWDTNETSSGMMTLYDPAMNPVTMNEDDYLGFYWVTLPADGVYMLKAASPEGDYSPTYYFTLVLTGGDEPNNTRATATDVPFWPVLAVNHDYLCDTDWYRFQGRAGDVLAGVNSDQVSESTFLHDAGGDPVAGHVLPADGTYYLEVLGYAGDKNEEWCWDVGHGFLSVEALWVSAAVDGLGGAANKRGDILTRKNGANQWQIVFDASDVGITKNVNAFERMPNGSILMSLSAAQNVAGLGKVQPQDIIRFNPTSLGDTTAGTFEWFLDGSDVGLTTAGEKIDAIYMQQDIENPLRISLTGSGSVARVSGGTLKVADEDILNLVGGVFGANSAGAWRTSLDGSAVPGLAKEDISNLARVEVYPAHDSVLLLGLDSAFTINGTNGTMFDVMNGDTWQPAVRQLTNKKIDGLAVGPAWTP